MIALISPPKGPQHLADDKMSPPPSPAPNPALHPHPHLDILAKKMILASAQRSSHPSCSLAQYFCSTLLDVSHRRLKVQVQVLTVRQQCIKYCTVYFNGHV